MKVAIVGYGMEGAASCQYWLDKGDEVTIFDQKATLGANLPNGVKTMLGPDVLDNILGYDLVVRTPGLNPELITTDGKIWSATNEFFKQCPAPIIGVTGTKGKGTTSSLIAEILKAAGKTVHLLGNIGTPALQVLPKIRAEDFVVFELSSFQLWDIEKSPETAVVLMIELDHQDVHKSFEEYVLSKANIVNFQTEDDLLVHHPTNKNSLQIAGLAKSHTKAFLTNQAAHILEGKIIIDRQEICRVEEVGLVGAHNLENICAAITAAWRYTQDIAAIRKAVSSFKGLPHRLEFVRELGGVRYYNDSFSSAAGAAIAAIRSFSQPTILICGGSDKGIDFDVIAKELSNSKSIKQVIIMGAVKNKLAASFKKYKFENFIVDETNEFKKIIDQASELSEPGDVVLLSPGTASFDMFKNFYERGEQFKKIVNEL